MQRTHLPLGRLRRSPPAERGVALVISLVLLVAMTIVGIATLSGTRMNERIASNAQQKSIAFEVAESAIDAVWDQNGIRNLIAAQGGSYSEPAAIPLPLVDAALSADFDQSRDGVVRFDVEASVTVRYCGEGAPVLGTGLSADESGGTIVGLLADVNGVATLDGSSTRADHVQRISLNSPRTGRIGGCTTPGL